jgi:hypothetical protein
MPAGSSPIAVRFSSGVNFRSRIRGLRNTRDCRCQFAAVISRSEGDVFASGADQPYNWNSARVHGSSGRRSDSGCADRLPTLSAKFKEIFMSAPSRRPEIRRRRTRAEKISKLRKRLAAASATSDKDRLVAKLNRVGLVSPGNPLIKSE